jgi:glycosyltransferase involved in cell wall biosynthesis
MSRPSTKKVRPRVLFICHNHPVLHPGGTEIFSHGLFSELKRTGAAEVAYLACTNDVHRERKPGTLFQTVGRSSDELLMWTGHFDRFMLSQIDLHAVVPELEKLLRSFRPDIVHLHHVLLIGVEALQVIRGVLPQARIVLTLHDYYPICVNDGQMTTPGERKPCHGASPDACHRCFPEIDRDRFVMRELYLKHLFTLVDRFVSPSDFLKRRYVAWGLEADRIQVVRNGIEPAEPAPFAPAAAAKTRSRFGFFGHLNPYKGALVAIEAARRLAARSDLDFSLILHGSSDFQTEAFKAELRTAVSASPAVTARGGYARQDIGALMAEIDWVIVPSVWWENAPLVIQEAFLHRRPVICTGHGGMAEFVRDGVDGLHFRAGDPDDLARRMQEAIEPELWQRLAAGIVPPRSIAEAADDHLALYSHLLADTPSPEESRAATFTAVAA